MRNIFTESPKLKAERQIHNSQLTIHTHAIQNYPNRR